MKFFKVAIISLLTLCSLSLVACGQPAKINISSRFDEVSWEFLTNSFNVGDEVKLNAYINDGYEGEIGVYVNGKKARYKNGVYSFIAEQNNNVQIDGDIYEAIDRIEFPHKVLHFGQDFSEMNESIKVYYKTGNYETISEYEVSEYPAVVRDQNITLTFIGGNHEYKRLVTITVADDESYLQYVKEKFSAAVKRDGVEDLVASNLFYKAIYNDHSFYYNDDGQSVWVLGDGSTYVALNANEYMSHKFSSMNEAIQKVAEYMPYLQFNIGDTAQTTYNDIISNITSAHVTKDDLGNVILSQATTEMGVYDYVMDKSLEILIALSNGEIETILDINVGTDIPHLPDVQWNELLS